MNRGYHIWGVIIAAMVVVYIWYVVKSYYFREFDEIIPGLYLGNLRDTQNPLLLERQRITHILSIIDQPVERLPKITYKQIVIEDVPSADMSSHFQETSDYI